jgi:hypothetical protein
VSDVFAPEDYPLFPDFDFDVLRVHRAGSATGGVLQVEVGFSLLVAGARRSEGPAVAVSTTHRLTYHGVDEADEQRVVEVRAPREAWPLFRAHVDRVLAEMDVPAIHAHRLPSRALERLAPDVLRETREADAAAESEPQSARP